MDMQAQVLTAMETLEQYSTAEELVNSLPTKVGYKGHFKALAKEQLGGEVFLGVATGNIGGIDVVGTKKDASSTGIMVITNKRILFITKLLWMTKVDSVGWSKFDSYSAQKGMIFGTINVMTSSSNSIKVSGIDKNVWQQAKNTLDAIML
ncbi:PH domain-containing protein [Priestia megaterium]|uniref:PH domain-containing protein n=1 Tax=Priestia megaterium TaxID=1404 RepID=UPI002E224D10|nr:PH domain-containing protein [Priestia megaterium]